MAKLNAYGLSLSALKLVHNYLQKCKQITKNGIAYSLWEEIVSGIPQGSILGPLLFNIFFCNLSLSTESSYFTNYADDTTPFVIGKNTEKVVFEFKNIAEKLFIWFAQNEMKANLDKLHSTTEACNFQLSETVIPTSHSRKLVGVTFPNTLNFEKHLTTICRKANRKLNALVRVTPYMNLQEKANINECIFQFSV